MRKLLAPNPLEVPGAQETGILNRIGDFANRGAIDPMEQQGLNTIGGTTNPNANLAAAQQYLQRISGPAITSAATASGMGRSGAVPEALAQEGTRMTLPILSDALNAQRTLGENQLQLGGQLRDRDLTNLQTSLSALEAQRLAKLQSTTKPQQLLLQAYGMPPQPTGAGTQWFHGSQNYYPSAFNTGMKAAQSVASIAGAFIGA